VADGFLGRWSQRKQALREGRAVEEPTSPSSSASPKQVSLPVPQAEATPPAPVPEKPPAPTLVDVQALKADSSFAPFVSRDVAPEVRNAAMKKLFTDPHYNVMDGLDIYIDDYSLPSPMPESMLRQMASAKFLKLFEEDEKIQPAVVPAHTLREDAHTPNADFMAQSELIPNLPETDNQTQHDHTDLRLQPNHAAGPQESGRQPG
jgi:hypothetical protein